MQRTCFQILNENTKGLFTDMVLQEWDEVGRKKVDTDFEGMVFVKNAADQFCNVTGFASTFLETLNEHSIYVECVISCVRLFCLSLA